jgi:hypothetical protein
MPGTWFVFSGGEKIFGFALIESIESFAMRDPEEISTAGARLTDRQAVCRQPFRSPKRTTFDAFRCVCAHCNMSRAAHEHSEFLLIIGATGILNSGAAKNPRSSNLQNCFAAFY